LMNSSPAARSLLISSSVTTSPHQPGWWGDRAA
jgi:hypothetical protein